MTPYNYQTTVKTVKSNLIFLFYWYNYFTHIIFPVLYDINPQFSINSKKFGSILGNPNFITTT